MKAVHVLPVLALAGGLSACLHDEHWEGTMDRCTGSAPNERVIMLLDPPMMTKANGYFGRSLNSSDDTWEMGAFKDGTAMAGSLKFEAVFTFGNNTERWQVDLKKAPLGDYEGTVDRNGSNTIRCDVKLSPAK